MRDTVRPIILTFTNTLISLVANTSIVNEEGNINIIRVYLL